MPIDKVGIHGGRDGAEGLQFAGRSVLRVCVSPTVPAIGWRLHLLSADGRCESSLFRGRQ